MLEVDGWFGKDQLKTSPALRLDFGAVQKLHSGTIDQTRAQEIVWMRRMGIAGATEGFIIIQRQGVRPF